MAASRVKSCSSSSSEFAVVVATEFAQKTRHKLEEDGLWDSSRRLLKLKDGKVAIPITESGKDILSREDSEPSHTIEKLSLPQSKKNLIVTPFQKLVQAVRQYLTSENIQFDKSIEDDIARHWEIHGDLVMLPDNTFTLTVWMNMGQRFWKTVADALDVARVARKQRVTTDGFRTPSVQLLLGDTGWVQHIDNGISYSYDVTKCMFSIGNITEKLRIAKLNCDGETVVDLYAGIGYFTLPYLVHANASMVHACEWNIHAVEALEKNLELNGVKDRCVIHVGDNRKVCPRGVADRVNLGLIPSSEMGWTVACSALKPQTGGVLHIHSNVSTHNVHNTGWRNETIKADMSTNRRVSHPFQSTEHAEKCDTLDGSPVHAQSYSCNDSCTEHVLSQTMHADDDNLCAHMPQSSKSVLSNDLYVSSFEVNSECKVEGSFAPDTNKQYINRLWHHWACHVANSIHKILVEIHRNEWNVDILHIEHVKSYAPHVDHLVVDIQCKPTAQ
ncbi:tRNA wybutosine-synthesizing protein 2 homolog [Glandiceps talaboti]